MKIYYFGCLVLLLLSIKEGNAQFLSRSVVSAYGIMNTSSEGYVSSTIGESISGTLSFNQTTLTQGFQQPLIINSRDSSFFSLDAVDVYPNPFTDLLHVAIEVKDINNYSIGIYSIQGREIETFEFKNIYSGIYEFNMEKIPPGVYLLHIRSSMLKTNRIFRIVKI
jgi:hypothetical protein